MARSTNEDAQLDELRSKLADYGVTLFERAPGRPTTPDVDDYAALIARLVKSGDARLRLAVPCLLAANDGALAATATSRAAAGLSAAEVGELGLLYRLARCLVASRAPYLAYVLSHRPTLPPLPIEPIDVPGPDELSGEKGLRFASESYWERGLPDLPGGVERQFDTWLDLASVRTGRRESA
jgi:hypothetical protein